MPRMRELTINLESRKYVSVLSIYALPSSVAIASSVLSGANCSASMGAMKPAALPLGKAPVGDLNGSTMRLCHFVAVRR